jgi:CheY-like chemotaxis protein
MQDFIDAGANAYLVKPVRRLELIEQVKRQLAAQSATVK